MVRRCELAFRKLWVLLLYRPADDTRPAWMVELARKKSERASVTAGLCSSARGDGTTAGAALDNGAGVLPPHRARPTELV